MPHDPYYFKLRGETQDKLDCALCDIVEDTVKACSDRDDELRSFRYILEQSSQPEGNEPWPGACNLHDTSPRELHNTVVAATWSAAKQLPYICLEAVKDEDAYASPIFENWLNLKAQVYGYEDALYDAIYLSAEGRYAPLYIGMRQDTAWDFNLPPPEPVDEGDEPTPQRLVTTEHKKEPCVHFRVPNPWDFYVYPVYAAGPQVADGAACAIERMNLTKEDLLLGVLKEGYDGDAVGEMIRKGPRSLDTDSQRDDADRRGIQESAVTNPDDAQPWECFQVIGRAPLLADEDGKPTIPDALMHRDCVWMVCPALGICFKQGYSPFPYSIRPYAIFNLVSIPNSMQGEGIVSMLADNFEEQTAITRFGINNMNLEATPAMTVAESWLTRYSKWTVAPGRWMPRQMSDPIGPKPLTWDVRSQSLIMPWLQHLDAKAHRLAASEGVNSALAGRVRKAAEVHFAEAMQQSKFDLFLSNLHRGVKDTFRFVMLILLKSMKERGELEQGDPEPDEVEQRFRFIPQASTDAIGPAQRMAKGMQVAQIVRSSLRYQAAVASGDYSVDDELTHRLLVLAGERNPERLMPQGQYPPVPMQPQQSGQNPVQGMAQVGQGAGMLQSSPFTPRQREEAY